VLADKIFTLADQDPPREARKDGSEAQIWKKFQKRDANSANCPPNQASAGAIGVMDRTDVIPVQVFQFGEVFGSKSDTPLPI
jgi:hypothetical protein